MFGRMGLAIVVLLFAGGCDVDTPPTSYEVQEREIQREGQRAADSAMSDFSEDELDALNSM